MTGGLPVPGADTGGPIERDDAALPPESSADARTGVSADGKASDGLEALRDARSCPSTWEQVEALAAILEPEAFDPDQKADERWREATKFVALNHAAKVITSDFRRVSEDDDTVERLAAALAEHDGHRWAGPGGKLESRADYQIDWAIASRTHYLARARAAVRALREET